MRNARRITGGHLLGQTCPAHTILRSYSVFHKSERGGTMGRVTSLDEAIAALDGGPWYRRSEVAALLGVTPSAILALVSSGNHPDFEAKAYLEWASKAVHLWSQPQVDAMRRHFRRDGAGSGRPRVWTLQESQERRRRYDLARYYARRAAALDAAGEPAKAAEARRKGVELQAELAEQLAERQPASQGHNGVPGGPRP